MNITTELEKLTSLRDRGDLSQVEFERAKALLLSDELANATSAQRPTADDREEKRKETKTVLLTAILATLAAAFSGGSAIIDPSLFTIGMLIFWVGLSSWWWISYSKTKPEN